MKKLKLFFAACALLLGGSNASAQQEPVSGTSYYLYNVESGLFLSRGSNWATKAVTNEVGAPWLVTINEGKYTLKMLDIYTAGDTGKGLGSNGFSDNGSPIEFTLDGDANGYKLKNGSNYLVSPETYGGNVLAESGKYTWQFLNVNEYKAKLVAMKTTQEAAIAATAGITLGTKTLAEVLGDVNNWCATDVTSKVPAATPSNSTWTREGVPDRGGNANDGSYGIERYQGGGTESYTVTGLTKGVYKVGVKAMLRSASNAACYSIGQAGYLNSSAYFSANGYIVQVKDWYSSCKSASNPNSTGEFVSIANEGGYYSEVYTYVGEDGKLDLKLVSEAYWSYSWMLFNGVTLTYYSDQVSEEDATAILNTANSIKDSYMGSGVKSALNSAISTFDANRTIANYNALGTAISNANASIESYASFQTAISNAESYKDYEPAFSAGKTIYSDAISAAQGVYNAAAVENCTAAINALTDGIHAAYESDYSTFANDYEYDYSTLLSPDLTKWAKSDYVVMKGAEHWNGLTDQRYYEQSGAEWGQDSWNHEASETPTLPAGKYVMSITARASVDVNSTMSVKVGNSDPITVSLSNKGSVGRGIMTDGVGSFADGTYANTVGRGWEYRFIEFTVAEESPVAIKFNSSVEGHKYNWVSIAAPLLKGNVHPNQIKLNQIHTLATTLKGYESKISAETYATFADDITAAESATTESEDLDDIIVKLQKDIDTAESEAEAFARGAAMNALIKGANSVVLEDEATAANWTPAPTYNDWSTEADNTGMVKPFLQNWKNKNDGALADNSLTYAPIRGIKNGCYEVSALVRIYSESGEEPNATSATFTVNGESVDLLNGTSFVFNNMKGVYQTVKVRMTIEDALNIGLAYSGANFNWIAWKNLKVTYLGSEVATAEDYDALNNAITAAEPKTLGFEAGEYAPYNNAAAFTSLAEAKAIDQSVVNAKETVVAATTALNNAAWTVNEDEVNAFFDGNFSKCLADDVSPLDYTPAGWTPSDNMRMMLKNVGEPIFDFENNNMNLPVGDSQHLHDGDLAGKEVVMGDVTFTCTDGPGTTETRYFLPNNKSKQLQIFKNGTFTLAAPEGQTIKSVLLSFANSQKGLTVDKGTYDNAGTWTGNEKEITFTSGGSRYIYTIAITTEKEKVPYPGLADASAKTALMSWPGGVTYGEQPGYEMPLKANTVYKLSLKAAGWNNESRSGVSVSVLNESKEGLALYNLGTPNCDIVGNEQNVAGMTPLEIVFVTGNAGNYVFHVQSGNNIVLSDFELKKAESTSLTISENGLPNFGAGAYSSVKLVREIKAGFNTLVVPFSMSQAEVEEQFGAGSVVYELKEFEGDVIHFQPADGVTANKPCILKAAKGDSEYSFSGRKVEKAAPTVETAGAVTFNGSYAASFTVPANDENYIVSGGKLYLVDSSVIIKGTRAYFSVVGNQAREISFDGVTGITTVENGEVKKAFTGNIFDLSGRKVKNPSKGIYVVEGKKVVF